MASLKVHIAQSLSSSLLLYPVIGENVIPFGLAVIFIDLDHAIEYTLCTKNMSPKGLFVHYDILIKNKDKNYLGFNLFHTIEFYLLILLLAPKFHILYYILCGFLFHHLLDQLYLVKLKKPFIRAFSVIEYIIRRKRCLTSIKALFAQGNVNVEGVNDLEKWLVKWNIKSAHE